ncbi:hypothetical protein GCM10022281_25050 [Sphingomonas rosea]|uniref:Fatty acid desaturase domain-containing protein n=1 Tax=Sphingomonas rosea TaxID=335605 RepID=A0ABP7UGD7_9SPHN
MGKDADRVARDRLRRIVRWQDLVAMRPADGFVECLHPLPWLGLSWWAHAQGWWPLGIAAAFMFFLTALRLNHEAIHRSLGFGRGGHLAVLHGLSFLMTGSNHAVAFNHMHHHAHVGEPDDHEGACGRMSMGKVLLFGPLFPFQMHWFAWTRGKPETRRRMAIDGGLNALMLALLLVPGLEFLRWHVALMIVAQCMTAFFAVWITHHDCEDGLFMARTQRSRLVNLLSYNMFFHLEHHLFPAVPVKRLARLADRIDAAVPAYAIQARRVLG